MIFYFEGVGRGEMLKGMEEDGKVRKRSRGRIFLLLNYLILIVDSEAN